MNNPVDIYKMQPAPNYNNTNLIKLSNQIFIVIILSYLFCVIDRCFYLFANTILCYNFAISFRTNSDLQTMIHFFVFFNQQFYALCPSMCFKVNLFTKFQLGFELDSLFLNLKFMVIPRILNFCWAFLFFCLIFGLIKSTT